MGVTALAESVPQERGREREDADVNLAVNRPKCYGPRWLQRRRSEESDPRDKGENLGPIAA